jgi:hypothetical protein
MQLETTFGEAYELPFDIELSSGGALSPVLAQPSDGAQLGSNLTSYLFTWDNQPDAVSYQFQLAADASFSSIIEQQNTTASSFQYPTMLPEGVYYWRVAAVNSCGSGPWSAVNDFSIIPVGVGELAFSALSISPNPATELIMIKGLIPGERYDIVDMTGRTCAMGFAPHGYSAILDIRALSPGIYFLRTGATSTKLIKK